MHGKMWKETAVLKHVAHASSFRRNINTEVRIEDGEVVDGYAPFIGVE